MVMGLVSRLSLANHFDSGSFLMVQALLSQDGQQRGGFWEVVGHVVSPFDLSRILPVGGGLLVPCSLLGPPAIKLMQMVSMVLGQSGQFQSVFPLTIPTPPHPCPMHEGFWVSTFPLPPDMIQLSDFFLSSRCYKEG